ncbi:MAG: LytTR family DNA-binding domain-containing protein [Bacteroidota bacterium]|nr:LytTR family DNA-binding domain-containing protein [Bacteroidota bacterium]
MTKQRFFYRKDGILQRINLDEIILLETAGNYVKFYSLEHVHMVRTSLDAALSQLPKNHFVQIHRSFVISIDHIVAVGKDFVSLISVPDKVFPLSKKFYAPLLELIKIIETDSPDSTN